MCKVSEMTDGFRAPYKEAFLQMQIITVRMPPFWKLTQRQTQSCWLSDGKKAKFNVLRIYETSKFATFVAMKTELEVLGGNARKFWGESGVFFCLRSVAECYFYRHLFSCLMRLVARQLEIKCYCEFYWSCGNSYVNKVTAPYLAANKGASKISAIGRFAMNFKLSVILAKKDDTIREYAI